MNIFIPQKLKKTSAPILVAVSGGSDSIAMLFALREELTSERLIVAHYNHGIRGEEASRDEAHVRELCEKLSVRFILGSGDVPSAAKLSGESIEMTARNMRREFLISTAIKNGCVAIATGHNCDDQVETLFLRLLRGAGLRGLGGIRPEIVNENGIIFFRPIINCSHLVLQEYLKERFQQTWCEDSTNTDLDILRNKLRHKIVPVFRENFGNAFSQPMLRTMELLRQDADCLDSIAKAELKKLSVADESSYATISVDGLVELHEAIRSRVLLEFIYSSHLMDIVTKQVVDRLWSLCEGDGSEQHIATLSQNCVAVRKGMFLKLLPLDAYINMQLEGEQSFYHALPEIMKLAPLSRVCLGTYEFGEMLHVALATEPSRQLIKPPRTPLGQYPVECTISASAFSEPLVLRSYEYGDKISPAGGNFTRKLSDIFTDLKLPKEFRRSIPLLATASGKVLWLPGYAVDASVAVVPGERSVKLTLSRYFKQTKIRI